jgi:hypothetical protein
MHVAIPGDRNVIKKEAENILKYKDLIIVIHCMWNVKPKVIPVIIGGTETISKSFRQYRSNIEECTKLRNYKKNNHTGHCIHTMKSANVIIQNTVHITCSTDCKYTITATLYTLENGLFQVYNCKYPGLR